MANATLDVDVAVHNVDLAVEKVINDADQNFPEAANIGDAVRQGDVYIQLIPDFDGNPMFYSKVSKPEFPVQLAPGNTKGSRHMLEESAGIEIWVSDAAVLMTDTEIDFNTNREQQIALVEKTEKYAMSVTKESKEEASEWNSPSQQVGRELLETLNFCGPIFKVKNRTTVSHPEHGNWILPAGTYRVVFQRTTDSDMRVQRVFD